MPENYTTLAIPEIRYKVTLVATTRKFMTVLNAMLKTKTLWKKIINSDKRGNEEQ